MKLKGSTAKALATIAPKKDPRKTLLCVHNREREINGIKAVQHVACDGRLLLIASRKREEGEADPVNLIPADVLRSVCKAKGEYSAGNQTLTNGTSAHQYEEIEGQYPNVDMIEPKIGKRPVRVVFDAHHLKRLAEAVITASEKNAKQQAPVMLSINPDDGRQPVRFDVATPQNHWETETAFHGLIMPMTYEEVRFSTGMHVFKKEEG